MDKLLTCAIEKPTARLLSSVGVPILIGIFWMYGTASIGRMLLMTAD